jgi:hypothetical protein
MAITLSDDEARALKTFIDKFMPELDYELARIKHQRDRHSLVALEETLQKVRQKL